MVIKQRFTWLLTFDNDDASGFVNAVLVLSHASVFAGVLG